MKQKLFLFHLQASVFKGNKRYRGNLANTRTKFISGNFNQLAIFHCLYNFLIVHTRLAIKKAPLPGLFGRFPACRAARIQVKQADRPDFVTAPRLAVWRYDSHSSRRRITPALKLSTRTLREQHHRVPI